MNKERVLGIELIIVSILVIISNLTITGAVVGTTTQTSVSLVAIVAFIVGAFIILNAKT